MRPPTLVLIAAIILLAGVVFGGCSRVARTEAPDRPPTSTPVAATATTDTSMQAAIDEAVEATIAAIPPTSTSVATPRPTTRPTTTPVPTPTPVNMTSLRQVWNGYVQNLDEYRGRNPRFQDLYDEQFSAAVTLYRLNWAGRLATSSFRGYLHDTNMRRVLLDYHGALGPTLDQLRSRGEWIRPDESISEFVERHGGTRRAIELGYFYNDDNAVELLIRDLSLDEISPLLRDSCSEGIRDEFDAVRYEDPFRLLAQEFAARNFSPCLWN